MTPLPEHPERDPALDMAWREHSDETPPAALDAAILAAAHRAVVSVPRDAGKQAAEATRPQRWWMPLAAAATIGAVALGILQTLPQESPVTAPPVSDVPGRSSARSNAQPSAPSDKLATTERRDAPRAAPESAATQPPAVAAARVVAESPVPATTRREVGEPGRRSLGRRQGDITACFGSCGTPAFPRGNESRIGRVHGASRIARRRRLRHLVLPRNHPNLARADARRQNEGGPGRTRNIRRRHHGKDHGAR